MSAGQHPTARVYAIKFSNGWRYTEDDESAELARKQNLPIVEYVPAEQLQEAVRLLERYGQHDEGCAGKVICTCGLTVLRAALAAPSEGEPTRFGINPGPLRLRGDVPVDDPNAGRCTAILKNGSDRCLNDATRDGFCGVHLRFASGQAVKEPSQP